MMTDDDDDDNIAMTAMGKAGKKKKKKKKTAAGFDPSTHGSHRFGSTIWQRSQQNAQLESRLLVEERVLKCFGGRGCMFSSASDWPDLLSALAKFVVKKPTGRPMSESFLQHRSSW